MAGENVNIATLLRPDVPMGAAQEACDKLCSAAMATFSLEQAMGDFKQAGISGDSGVKSAARTGGGRELN